MEFSPVTPSALGLRWSKPLYIAGSVPAVPCVAVIGSRAARRPFMRCVPAVVEALREAGMALVSGGAIGIDACGHRAALRLGVPQVAVLPGPPDRLYPIEHAPLFHDIVAAGGAVLCPWPPGVGLRRGMFASRNQLVVQLSAWVVAIEAGARSGTQGTLRLALREGTPVCGIAGTPGVAWALERGAMSLGPPDPDRVRAQVGRALCGLEALEVWPVSLRPLQMVLDRQKTVTVDDFDDPLTGAVLLAEAEGGGWITESAPGRYVRAR